MNISGTTPPPPPPPPPPGFVLSPLPLQSPVQSDSLVTFTASASGSGVSYSWFFDDGTPQTAPSSSPTISHSFTEPGIYYVTVTASRSGSAPQSQTVTVMVHLPLSGNAPAASGDIVYRNARQRTASGWSTRTTIRSRSSMRRRTHVSRRFAVGARPRALAIAPDGRVWVTNKLASTISVIDPQSLSIDRTVTLPFASQPFGIAFAPDGGAAFVALEGSGALLKLNPSTGAQLDSVALGSNPRHLSISASGSKALCLAVHHTTARGREYRERAVRQWWRRSPRDQPQQHERAPDDYIALEHQAGFREPGQRSAQLSRRAGHLAGRCQRLGAFQAGQRPARLPAQRPESQLPEHRARHQFANRARARAGGPAPLASTTTMPVSRAPPRSILTACTCSSRWKPAGSGRGRRLRRLGDLPLQCGPLARRGWRYRRMARRFT